MSYRNIAKCIVCYPKILLKLVDFMFFDVTVLRIESGCLPHMVWVLELVLHVGKNNK